MQCRKHVEPDQLASKIWIYTALKTTYITRIILTGRVAQSVKCLATEACLTADPGVASLIPAWSHTFVEIDYVFISTVILLLSPESFKKGFCQFQAKVCARSTGYCLFKLAQEKVWLGELTVLP